MYTSPSAEPDRRESSTAHFATTGPIMPSTVAGMRKTAVTTKAVRRSQGRLSRPGVQPTTALIQRHPSTRAEPRPYSGPIARDGSTRSARRPPRTLPRQMPARITPMTLVQTISDPPTCCATSRLATSSSTMMHRLLKKERA